MSSPETPVRKLRFAEIAAVAVLVALVIVGTSRIEAEPAERVVDWLAYACGGVAAASLVFWRRFSIAVAAVVSIALGVYFARHYPLGPALLPVPLAMAALGYTTSRRVAWLGVAAMLTASAIGFAIANELVHVLIMLGWGVAGVLAGQAIATRGERVAAERERLNHAHEMALSAERLRVAQDVHDSVAHAITTINVQSGVAAHLAEHKPEQVAVALEAIRVASRDALEELGSILGVLREPGTAAPLAPLGGLDQIADLVKRASNDGLRVTLDQHDDLDPLPAAVGTAAYRCVQEALTNTLRHAGPQTTVGVTVARSHTGSFDVTVIDDGPRGTHVATPANEGATSSGGFGLVGMRERVESTGGHLAFGPIAPSGFKVAATWPTRSDQ